jgi:hypothetical protein
MRGARSVEWSTGIDADGGNRSTAGWDRALNAAGARHLLSFQLPHPAGSMKKAGHEPSHLPPPLIFSLFFSYQMVTSELASSSGFGPLKIETRQIYQTNEWPQMYRYYVFDY